MKFLTAMAYITMCLSAAPQERPTGNTPQTPAKPEQSGSSTPTVPNTSEAKLGWSYEPDAGVVYRQGDFKWTSWGYGEKLFDPGGEGGQWRRVRQGMEFDLPRFTQQYRTAFVYEVDLTDNNFFRTGPKWRIAENLFWAVQNAKDAGKFRALIGQNTHILTLEDYQSSGNLPTINRSLILEEHGSVSSFGTQFGVQVTKALSSRYSISGSAQDNRGSFNTDKPRYNIGNSLATKLTAILINDEKRGRKLTVGAGVDHTRDYPKGGHFSLASAIAFESLGSVPASGNKLSFEGDIIYSGRLGKHPYTLESQGLQSNFSGSGTTARGIYGLMQMSVFDKDRFGDLDPFVRYDVVQLGQERIHGSAVQQALRTGVNYNLPFSRKLVNLHLEYARNAVHGPGEIVAQARAFNEFRVELRVNVTRYVRH